MSITITPRTNIFYVNFSKLGSLSKPVAIADNRYPNELIKGTTDWIIAVERFVVPIQTIPMFTPADGHGAGFLSIVDRASGAPTGHGANLVNQHYSLTSFLTEINDDAQLVSVGGQQVKEFAVILKPDGRIRVESPVFTNNNIILGPYTQHLFDLPATLTQNTTGATPIFDRFDRLKSIRIETDLPMQSDYLSGNASANVISDYISPTSYETSSSINNSGIGANFSLTEHVRQNVIYEPNYKRFIMLRGNQPINQITLRAIAIIDGGNGSTREEIRLPGGTEFSVKLGFYSKSSILPPKKFTPHHK